MLLALVLGAYSVPGAAADGSCDNAGIRAATASEALPDCRAYERVTPVDKGGADVTGTVPFARAARDGGAATYLSGVSRSALQEYTPRFAVRSAAGWASGNLLPAPPGDQFADLVGLTPDLGTALVAREQPGAGTAAELLLRSAGEERTLVPFTNGLAPRFVGAAEDGSLVVFESPAPLPAAGAALTGLPNLYAWDRARGEVRLIGILNANGSPPPDGAIGGSYDWAQGVAGAALEGGGPTRGYYTQDQHAVSVDGSAVFFTAGKTGHLYLRRNPASAQSPLDAGGRCTDPSLACTTMVSASRKSADPDPEGSAPAAFMGAGADGATAYFTSTAELTDDANTGPDPAPPSIVRAGLDGNPASVEPEFVPAKASGVAVDGAHVYWADPLRGSIGRAQLDGSGVEGEFLSGLANPRWVAVDGQYVYWTSNSGGGSIGRARLDLSAPPEPGFISGAGSPQGVAVDATKVYWANGAPNGIGRASIDGSAVEPAFHPLSRFEFPQGVAVDGAHIYWTENEPTGYVSRSDLDGTHETFHFVGSTAELRGLALDGQYVYWVAAGSGTIGRFKLDLGAAPGLYPEAGRAIGLAVDGSHLYWASEKAVKPGHDLYRYDARADSLTDLSVAPGDPNGAEVQGVLGISEDGSHVYFAANGVLASGANARGETALPGTCKGLPGAASGSCNLYVSHGGTVEFVARLQADGELGISDAADWAPAASVSELASFQPTARVSADGRTVLFRSRRQLDAHPTEGVPQLYRYRVGEPGPVCVSCGTGAVAPTARPTLGTNSLPYGVGLRPASALVRNLSADGDRVFFESAESLVAADRNGAAGCPGVSLPELRASVCQDVYEWEAAGRGSCPRSVADDGCLYLLSDGTADRPAFLADASASGDDAFVFTAAPVVAADADELVDLYDARVGGGLAEAPADECRGEACRPPRGPTPAPPPPATTGLGPARRIPPCRPRKRAGRHRHAGPGRAAARRCHGKRPPAHR
jgi:sugar lactone lactonase YvrE